MFRLTGLVGLDTMAMRKQIMAISPLRRRDVELIEKQDSPACPLILYSPELTDIDNK